MSLPAVQGALILNPHLQFKPERSGGSITALAVRAPVKGQSMRITRISRDADSPLFEALLIHAAMGTLDEATFAEPERSRLSQMGVLLAEEQVSSPVSFWCDLTDLPGDYVPVRARRSPPTRDGVTDLFVNEIGRAHV